MSKRDELNDKIEEMRRAANGRADKIEDAMTATIYWVLENLGDGDDYIKKMATHVGDYTEEAIAVRNMSKNITDGLISIDKNDPLTVSILPIMMTAKLLMEIDKIKLAERLEKEGK